MAFYKLEADSFDDLTHEAVYPSLLRKKGGPIPPDGQPEHQPSDAEKIFASLAISAFPKYEVRREVLLEDICEVDRVQLAQLLSRKHKSRPEHLEEIVNRASAKLAARIGRKRSDFLLFEPASGSLRGAVEVDGPYHLEQPQVSFDYSKNLIFCGLGVALLRLSSEQVKKLSNTAPSNPAAAFNSLMRTARANWDTFKKWKTVANMQLHLTFSPEYLQKNK